MAKNSSNYLDLAQASVLGNAPKGHPGRIGIPNETRRITGHTSRPRGKLI